MDSGDNMTLPTNIDPCPILESIFEIRFVADLPGDAIFGVVYNHFKKDYPDLEKLPILQIPEQIRSQDPNLMCQPSYRLKNDRYLIQIGPKVLNIVSRASYGTWGEFSDKINATFNDIDKLGIVKEIEKVSLRYVNFFENTKIIDKSNLSISLKSKLLSSNDINLDVQIMNQETNSLLKILTSAGVQIKDVVKKGSVVDIETCLNKIDEGLSCESLKTVADILHADTKALFYKLLSDSYIDSLEVTY